MGHGHSSGCLHTSGGDCSGSTGDQLCSQGTTARIDQSCNDIKHNYNDDESQLYYQWWGGHNVLHCDKGDWISEGNMNMSWKCVDPLTITEKAGGCLHYVSGSKDCKGAWPSTFCSVGDEVRIDQKCNTITHPYKGDDSKLYYQWMGGNNVMKCMEGKWVGDGNMGMTWKCEALAADKNNVINKGHPWTSNATGSGGRTQHFAPAPAPGSPSTAVVSPAPAPPGPAQAIGNVIAPTAAPASRTDIIVGCMIGAVALIVIVCLMTKQKPKSTM